LAGTYNPYKHENGHKTDDEGQYGIIIWVWVRFSENTYSGRNDGAITELRILHSSKPQEVLHTMSHISTYTELHTKMSAV